MYFWEERKKFTRFGFFNQKDIYKEANEELKKWDLPEINFDRQAGGLNIENRKMAEIVRALSIDPDIIILDEVTQSLSHDNRSVVYKLIDKFREMGRSVLLISHDLEETLEIADTITVLRDGKIVDTVVTKEVTESELKRMMVGREIEGDYYRTDEEEIYEDEMIFTFDKVSAEGGIKDLSFEIHKGEILGFCGLSDSGIHDVGKIAYGIEPVSKGKVVLNSENEEIKSAKYSLNHKVAYVPKDRDADALMMSTSIMNNFCLPSLEELAGKAGFLSHAAMVKKAEEAKEQFNVKCTGIAQNVSGLSGGNKQKVNLGRWMVKDLQLLIIDCPTRGVDVGVKAYIYQCMNEAKKKGLSMLLITDELTEAMGMSDNIIVMKDGMMKKR